MTTPNSLPPALSATLAEATRAAVSAQQERIEDLKSFYLHEMRTIQADRLALRCARDPNRQIVLRERIASARWRQRFLILERRYLRGVANNVLYLREAGLRYKHSRCAGCGQEIDSLYWRDRGWIWLLANGQEIVFCRADECRAAAEAAQRQFKVMAA